MNQFNKLKISTTFLHPTIQHILKRQGTFLAGGYLHANLIDYVPGPQFSSAPKGDIDVYVNSPEVLTDISNYLTSLGYKHYKTSEFAESFASDGPDIQLVKAYNQTPEEVVQSFDFLNLQLYANFDGIFCSQVAEHLLSRNCIILNGAICHTRPLWTLQRLYKYLHRGHNAFSAISNLYIMLEEEFDVPNPKVEYDFVN